jgi:predicted secreted protein
MKAATSVYRVGVRWLGPLACVMVCLWSSNVVLDGKGEDVMPPKKTDVITVAKDTTFSVNLDCAAGRGFSWRLAETNSHSKLQLIKQTFTNSAKDIDGATGVQTFHFKALAPGTANLQFIYVQPFQKPYPVDAPKTNIMIKIQGKDS